MSKLPSRLEGRIEEPKSDDVALLAKLPNEEGNHVEPREAA